jgi:hypothetical protein
MPVLASENGVLHIMYLIAKTNIISRLPNIVDGFSNNTLQ